MGIAIAVFVIPAFFLVGAISLWLAMRSGGFTTDEIAVWKRVALNVAGFFSAFALTVGAVGFLPSGHGSDWEHLFRQIGLVLLCPLFLGLGLLAIQKAVGYTRRALVPLAAGVLFASIPTPIAGPFMLRYFKDLESRSKFEQVFEPLCKNAYVTTPEQVSHATSLAFVRDSFAEPSTAMRGQLEIGEWSGFILNQSLLTYIERLATKESGLSGKSRFERVSTGDQRILRGSSPAIQTKYIYEPIDAIAADYIVQSEMLPIDPTNEFGIGGAKITIVKRDDGRVIREAQYYWSTKLHRSCPDETHGGLFIYFFIAEALGVLNPDGPKRILSP